MAEAMCLPKSLPVRASPAGRGICFEMTCVVTRYFGFRADLLFHDRTKLGLMACQLPSHEISEALEALAQAGMP